MLEISGQLVFELEIQGWLVLDLRLGLNAGTGIRPIGMVRTRAIERITVSFGVRVIEKACPKVGTRATGTVTLN